MVGEERWVGGRGRGGGGGGTGSSKEEGRGKKGRRLQGHRWGGGEEKAKELERRIYY